MDFNPLTIPSVHTFGHKIENICIFPSVVHMVSSLTVLEEILAFPTFTPRQTDRRTEISFTLGLNFSFCRVIDTATAQLTKTAITVTAIFIVTMGYDNFYYVLGYTGVLNYKMNSPVQKIGTGIIVSHQEDITKKCHRPLAHLI